ncbi:MAG TPA: response regulator [Pyrinomonadaceae bacterium]|nr:response regulator [Pyrinomonadaceae bacterium]
MSEANLNEDSTREDAPTVARRALVVADDEACGGALRESLASIGFEAARASAQEAARRIEEFAPQVVLFAFGERDGEGRLVTLARRLRSEPSTFALPLVFLFRDDGRTLRSAALRVGADDYFAEDAPREELSARLDSLLWRVEAGRRAAPTVAEQRDEIDNFIFLLDAVTTDARQGRTGALALIEARRNPAGARAPGEEHSDDVNDGLALNNMHDGRALAEAHGFLKLNLRRVDAVAFYGPATLLVYLPGADANAARSTLDALREEFLETRPDSDLSIGISSFPAHGAEVEELVEQAEAALDKARVENSTVRVFVYDSEGAHPTPLADIERHSTAEAPRRTTTIVPDGTLARSLATAGTSSDMNARVAAKTQTGDGQGASTNHVGVASQAGARRRSGKIRRLMLVVSDAARMAQVNLLMRSAGYEVRAAFDGQHALNLLRIDRPDLLVVDYELHGMDGIEMLKRLAKQSSASTPPALMLVPAGREDLRREGREAGARGFVNLPYDAVELLDTLGDFAEGD